MKPKINLHDQETRDKFEDIRDETLNAELIDNRFREENLNDKDTIKIIRREILNAAFNIQNELGRIGVSLPRTLILIKIIDISSDLIIETSARKDP